MKKLLVVGFLLVFALISCKKDYTCACSINVSGEITNGSITYHDTKKAAAAECDSLNETANFGDGQITTTTCSIQ